MTDPSCSGGMAESNPNPGRCGRLLRGWLGSGLLCALLAVAATGCTGAAAKQKEQKTVEVTVTTPITDDVLDYQDFTGRLDAFRTVEIRARVTGYLTTEIMFREGDRVKKDQPLYLIDPRPYKAAYDQAQAQYEQAITQIALNQATLNYARVTLIRDKAAGNATAQQMIDQDEAAVAEAEARVASAKATVASAKANVENARISLDFTRITAPFDGRISRRLIDPGNDVTADNTLLTTLVTETPVYAYFDVDERTFLDLQKLQAEWLNPLVKVKAGLSLPGVNPLPVDSGIMLLAQSKVLMRLANEEKYTRIGVINFVDNRVIATSGTIRMRGVFENDSGDLTSGLFARVRLPIGKPYKALLVPDEALLSDQGRKYLYVVNDNNEVVYRDVELGQLIEGLRVIKKGLSPGEKVIVVGMQRVRPKQNVAVKTQEPPKPPVSPLKMLMPRVETAELKVTSK
jgi:RND family efflux transporter MFP subunit